MFGIIIFGTYQMFGKNFIFRTFVPYLYIFICARCTKVKCTEHKYTDFQFQMYSPDIVRINPCYLDNLGGQD